MLLTLLMWVIVLGIVAWVVQQITMPHMFRVVAWAIIMIVLVIILFRFLTTMNLGI